MPTPTDEWMARVDDYMPPLTGPEGTAERLLLLLHYGVDFNSWIGGRARTYWDRILPERVIEATYRSRNLREWWQIVSDELNSQPRTTEQRHEIELLLREDGQPVLEVLRRQVTALILRTRIVRDAVADSRRSYS
ncbi:hypothetical protein GS504_01855 [Rhodococcus hoagii]|nr:hypothetical protein [Prescottella equi]NKS72231.1 hypothetical protein [Prescottella equi]